MEEIGFERGLRCVKKLVRPELRQTSDTLQLLQHLCNEFSSKLIRDTIAEFKKSKKRKNNGITPDHAQNALKKLLKTKLKDYASLEGQKAVYKYRANILRYDDREALKAAETISCRQQKNSKLEKFPGSEFLLGLNALSKSINRDRLPNYKAKENLGILIHEISNALAYRIALVGRERGQIIADDVETVVRSTFGPVMADHALANGKELLLRFDNRMVGVKFLKGQKDQDVASVRRSTLFPPTKSVRVQQEQRRPEQPAKPKVLGSGIFKEGLRKLALDVHNSCPLDNKVAHALDVLLSEILRKLAEMSNSLRRARSSSEISHSDVENSTQQMIPGNMVIYAMSEGRRALALYAHGMLYFHPVSKKKVRSRSETSIKTALQPPTTSKPRPKKAMKPLPRKHHGSSGKPDFSRGIIQLVTEDPQAPSLERSANAELARILLDLCRYLGEEAVRRCETRTLGEDYVSSAVAATSTGELRSRAIEAGYRATRGPRLLETLAGDMDSVSLKSDLTISTTQNTYQPEDDGLTIDDFWIVERAKSCGSLETEKS